MISMRQRLQGAAVAQLCWLLAETRWHAAGLSASRQLQLTPLSCSGKRRCSWARDYSKYKAEQKKNGKQ
jgi:hypothetical protein